MPYSYTAHKFGLMPRTGIELCLRCGLLPLDNLLTRWAIRMGCYYDDHPDWSSVKVDLVRKHQEERR